MKKHQSQKGFVSTLLLIIVALGLLKYFLDWSIFDALSSEKGQATLTYIKELIVSVATFIKDLFITLTDRKS